MELQGRTLSSQMEGSDVALLQSELHQLGYEVPADETTEQIFGAATETRKRCQERVRNLFYSQEPYLRGGANEFESRDSCVWAKNNLGSFQHEAASIDEEPAR